MMALPRAERAEELLDAPRHELAELEQSLGHVAAVNRWLGGAAAVTRYIKPLLVPGRPARVLDVATGSADIPLRLARWARTRARQVELLATDVHPQMLEIARRRCRAYPEISIQAADARRLPYADRSFDASMLSLALHHFDDAQQLEVLCEMARVTKHRVLVNDLERGWLNYLGARLLAATLWRHNRLTRHDGPLSVRRSFTRRELQDIGDRAGLGGRVERHFFQRIVLVGNPRSHSDAAVSTELR
ncbi:MAG TPA: methyltransferase domain-containing protein [Longimicrobiales bacterium]